MSAIDTTVTVAARMDPQLRAELEQRAFEADRTLSGEVRRAIKLYLADSLRGGNQEHTALRT